jgi:glyoxylase-like metal-dependent hydrolase (beta-lactamase superfamily II)
VAEGGEFTMVDAGYPGYWKYLTAGIDALGAAPDAIRAVILTHHHADHAGTAARLRSTAGARVLVGSGDA